MRRLVAKPNLDLMWKIFPDHTLYPTLTTLFTYIGGQLASNVQVPGFGPTGNTCAVRMSRAFNYGAMPISAKLVASLRLHPLVGADKRPYLFRVSEMRTYIAHALGVASRTVTRNFNTAFTGKRGIVAFEVRGWSDASGHVALWNGSAFKEPKHDDFRLLADDPATPKHEPATTRMTLWPL